MKTFSFRHRETGAVHAQRFSTDAAGHHLATHVANNTPAGYEAVEGELDYQPPQPSLDHEWDADARRWQLLPELAAAQERRKTRQAKIRELERGQARAVREAVLTGNHERLAAIDAQIAALRE